MPAKQNYEFTFPDIPFPLEIPLNNYPEGLILCAVFLCHIISKLTLVKTEFIKVNIHQLLSLN